MVVWRKNSFAHQASGQGGLLRLSAIVKILITELRRVVVIKMISCRASERVPASVLGREQDFET
jgi:hypothetical protein